uniref:UDP-N-acetylglucosamine 2-epimerase (non-hydrolyzing) n=1 Tax=Desulfobacca acetoxidans TaxID=60893 RepID=A0A7V6DQJ0_9BACT
MKKILLIFGTRPEAIKMAPLALRLKAAGDFDVRIAVTAQHRQMLDQVLEIFAIVPDFDLDLMTQNQDLFDVTARVLLGLRDVLRLERPEMILVHGDTTTTLAAALAAYYCQIPVGHVEAGLRTRDKYRPYPEELNRHLTGVITDYHFAPTPWARDNLLAEGVPPERVWVTGNTVIDALRIIHRQVEGEKDAWLHDLAHKYSLALDDRRLILVTGHRRENFGEGFRNICLALRNLAEQYQDVHIIYPVHLNPNVQGPVYEILGSSGQDIREAGAAWHTEMQGGGRLSLLPPLDYAPFVFLMSRSYLVLTDSGGIQEEAPALGKPVLVMRDVTERPEGVWAGTVKLVGPDRHRILAGVKELLDDENNYAAMARAKNPYGDGWAANRIVEVLASLL